ncbi:hypothetical protein SAMD00019534_044040 [Acytostelium subglobosum LB1]|uniref:hypothetical protein n=1 Tax=Acytostelium subglobosum LB1 TaxID=1410327 RepID=UPI000644B6CD|nr:hypothetical protein SAMD00019534_044040 [Acytostelium subglobosum LB1]GAM21229.1 hypothetical protein SAMD00019534_044040 [Acytostelium subglobosum LB1]|eukprot:XP_012755348.1 hypothetical protein SAMD00019534_044040 [Acytostelium subglobosum LB1]
MIGILSKEEIERCRSLIPKEQTLLSCLSMLLLTNTDTMSHSKRTIRTYNPNHVAFLLTDLELFVIGLGPIAPGSSVNIHARCKLCDVCTVQTGYLHSSSSLKDTSPTSDGVHISDRKTSSNQYAMKITPKSRSTMTLMSASPVDTLELQKERILKIASTLNTLVREAIIKHKVEEKLDVAEKVTISNVYYKCGDLLIEGDIHLNLQKISFVQKHARDLNLNLLRLSPTENYSFSIDTITVYECKQSELKLVHDHSSVIISAQGKTPEGNTHHLFCFKKSEIITESQDIVDQVVMASLHHSSGNHGEPSKSFTYHSESSDSSSYLQEQDFVLVDDPDILKEEAPMAEEEEDISLTSESYRTVLDDKPTHHPYKNNFKVKSDIMSETEMLWVQSHLPLRHNDDPLELVYSTNKNGISIRTFFSRLANRSPCIMVIRDDRGHVFGAFTSDPWNTEKTIHYGSGETFLFKMRPEMKKYPWSRINDDFMLSTKEEFISLGSGGKGVGLWIDDDLLYGSTNRCDTFNNETLSYNTDFKVIEMEVWSPETTKKPKAGTMMNATELFGTTFTYKPPTRSFNPYA